MKTKTFDCIQMKRRGAEAVQKKMQGKTLFEQLDFWKQATEQLKQTQNKIRKSK